MNGIVAFGTYIPYYRLERKAVAETLGVPGAAGTRSVASYDEDSTSMGVEAARTGEIGDGRVFVLPVLESYRIRTGEREE